MSIIIAIVYWLLFAVLALKLVQNFLFPIWMLVVRPKHGTSIGGVIAFDVLLLVGLIAFAALMGKDYRIYEFSTIVYWSVGLVVGSYLSCIVVMSIACGIMWLLGKARESS